MSDFIVRAIDTDGLAYEERNIMAEARCYEKIVAFKCKRCGEISYYKYNVCPACHVSWRL